MPGGLPTGLEIGNPQSVVNAAASVGIAVTCAATAHVKGAYVQLTPACSSDVSWMTVSGVDFAGGTTFLIDIAAGASGQEKVLVSNLVVQASFTQPVANVYQFPVQIPKGTRIAARTQGSRASDDCMVAVQLFDAAVTMIEGAATIDAIGALVASSRGTTMTAGAANTKGAWVSLGTAQRDYAGLYVGLDNQVNVAANSDILFDIGMGASGAQKVIVPNTYTTFLSTTSTYNPGTFGPLFTPIAAGQTIWARVQAEQANLPVDVSVYAFAL